MDLGEFFLRYLQGFFLIDRLLDRFISYNTEKGRDKKKNTLETERKRGKEMQRERGRESERPCSPVISFCMENKRERGR